MEVPQKCIKMVFGNIPNGWWLGVAPSMETPFCSNHQPTVVDIIWSGWWARATPLKNMSSSIKGWWMKPNINGKMPNWWQPVTTNQIWCIVHVYTNEIFINGWWIPVLYSDLTGTHTSPGIVMDLSYAIGLCYGHSPRSHKNSLGCWKIPIGADDADESSIPHQLSSNHFIVLRCSDSNPPYLYIYIQQLDLYRQIFGSSFLEQVGHTIS